MAYKDLQVSALEAALCCGFRAGSVCLLLESTPPVLPSRPHSGSLYEFFRTEAADVGIRGHLGEGHLSIPTLQVY